MKMYGACTQCAPNEPKCHAKIIDEKDYILRGVLYHYPAFLFGCLEIACYSWRRVLDGKDQ